MEKIKQEDCQKIKIIVFDLDGTLLNRFKKISKQTIKYLIKLQEAGYILVLATGRFYYELIPYIKQLKLKEYQGYVVCCNGLSVHNLKNDEVFVYDYLNHDDLNKLQQLARQYKINLRTNYQNQYQLQVNRYLTILIPIIKLLFINHYDLSFYRLNQKTPWQKVGKLCFLSTPGKLNKIAKIIKQQYPGQYQIYFTNAFCFELVKNNVNKKYALDYICQQLNLSMDNVLAFGDSGNDELLLQSAKIGIVMKNGYFKTKSKCRYVSIKTNNQAGVLDCLKRLFD